MGIGIVFAIGLAALGWSLVNRYSLPSSPDAAFLAPVQEYLQAALALDSVGLVRSGAAPSAVRGGLDAARARPTFLHALLNGLQYDGGRHNGSHMALYFNSSALPRCAWPLTVFVEGPPGNAQIQDITLGCEEHQPQPGDRYAEVLRPILDAWKTADVVCLGEDHGRKYDSDLRIALVRHSEFPWTVRVIVVEFANPVHQALLDHFILDGAALLREELSVVWRDASGAEVWESPIYEEFLRAVQQVNVALPKDVRVRVLGGDSPVDWQKITRPEELAPLLNRGGSIRSIIAQQILDLGLKGLAIYGARHCDKVGGGFPGDLAGKYDERRMWSVEPLVEAEGSRKGKALLGLGDAPAYVVIAGTKWAATPAGELLQVEPKFTMGDILDAVVYHGAVPDSVVRADLSTLNAKYGAEFARRRSLRDAAFKLQRRP